jgi:hypothetical protein
MWILDDGEVLWGPHHLLCFIFLPFGLPCTPQAIPWLEWTLDSRWNDSSRGRLQRLGNPPVFHGMASGPERRRRIARGSGGKAISNEASSTDVADKDDVVVHASLRTSSSVPPTLARLLPSPDGPPGTAVNIVPSLTIVRLSCLLVTVGCAVLSCAVPSSSPEFMVSLDVDRDVGDNVVDPRLDHPRREHLPDLISLHKLDWNLGGRQANGPTPRQDSGVGSLLANPTAAVRPAINETTATNDHRTGEANERRDGTTWITLASHKSEAIASENVVHPNGAETNATRRRRKRKHQQHMQQQQQQQQQHLSQNIETKPTKLVHRGYTSGRELLNETHNPHATHAELKKFYRIPPGGPPHGGNDTIDWTKLWNHPNSTLPQWMRDYLNWHDFKRRTWSRASFQDNRWLIMQCLHSDRKCGGTSDRLKPVLYLLRVAYYTKRILLIHWAKPAPLTQFLVPPRGGVDWTIPSWMEGILLTPTVGTVVDRTERGIRDAARDSQLTLARAKMQDYHGGKFYYDQELVELEPNFDTVFAEVWKTFFTPSPAVRRRLEGEMATMGLTPYGYTAAHCRVLYGVEERPDWIQQSWAANALNCASELRSAKPIFFTSDSPTAIDHAKRYGEYRNATVATRRPSPDPPLHIDFGWRHRPASDFFDGFVDLYILAQADCVTYNKGGFGVLGLLMSRNATCGLRQDALDRPKIQHPCSWMGGRNWMMTPSSNSTTSHRDAPVTSMRSIQEKWRDEPFYLEPMDLGMMSV